MAEVPEEIVVILDVDDKASSKLRSFGSRLVLLGANVSYVTKAFGIQNQAIDSVIGATITLGHIVRAVTSAKYVLAVATNVLNALEAQSVAASTASTAAKAGQVGAATTLTGANYRLAASFAAVNAAMGPAGWLALGLGVVGAGVVGAYAGGAFNRGPTQTRIGEGITVSIGRADFRTIADAEKEVKNTATMMNNEFRRSKH